MEEAIAAHREALRLNRDPIPNIPNNLAWALALTPDRPPSDYDEAAALARKAIDLASKEGGSYNTLALCEYRRGRWDDSIAAAERSISAAEGRGRYGKVLAGHGACPPWRKDEAITWFDKAIAWTKEKAPKDADLLRFWAEAAELLGRPGPAEERR